MSLVVLKYEGQGHQPPNLLQGPCLGVVCSTTSPQPIAGAAGRESGIAERRANARIVVDDPGTVIEVWPPSDHAEPPVLALGGLQAQPCKQGAV